MGPKRVWLIREDDLDGIIEDLYQKSYELVEFSQDTQKGFRAALIALTQSTEKVKYQAIEYDNMPTEIGMA